MNLFRRASQKQYDGPATSAAVNYQSNSDLIVVDRQKKEEDERKKHQRQLQSSSSRRHNHMTSSSSKKKNALPDRHHVPTLASGISSRRTSQKVRNHLPARVMSPAITENSNANGNNANGNNANYNGGRLSGIPTNITFSNSHGKSNGETSSNVNNDDGSNNHQFQAQNTHARKKPQMPMEHDGGVLCLCAVPAQPSAATSVGELHIIFIFNTLFCVFLLVCCVQARSSICSNVLLLGDHNVLRAVDGKKMFSNCDGAAKRSGLLCKKTWTLEKIF